MVEELKKSAAGSQGSSFLGCCVDASKEMFRRHIHSLAHKSRPLLLSAAAAAHQILQSLQRGNVWLQRHGPRMHAAHMMKAGRLMTAGVERQLQTNSQVFITNSRKLGGSHQSTDTAKTRSASLGQTTISKSNSLTRLAPEDDLSCPTPRV